MAETAKLLTRQSVSFCRSRCGLFAFNRVRRRSGAVFARSPTKITTSSPTWWRGREALRRRLHKRQRRKSCPGASRRNILCSRPEFSAWVMERTRRKMVVAGNCYVHEFTGRSISKIRESIPVRRSSRIPECTTPCACSPMKFVDGKNGDVFARDRRQTIIVVTEAGMLHPLQGNSRQSFHSRSDRALRMCRVPVHENEHAGEGVQCIAAHGAGNPVAGSGAPTSRSADFAHAGTEQVTSFLLFCHSERSRGISYYWRRRSS